MDNGEHTSILAVFGKELLDLVSDFAVGDLDVVLGGAIVGHEGKEAIIGDIELKHKSQWTQRQAERPKPC
jgi:hypothetical protein